MKLEGLTEELALQLEAAWAAALPSQVDARRTTDYLAWLLTESDSEWYQIEGHRAWLYIMNIVPGLGADVHALNLDGWAAVEPDKVREELRSIMEEHKLERLTAVIPAHIGKLHKALRMLGFTKEGRMRSAAIFNGRPADMCIYGLLRREVEPAQEGQAAPKRRRRRRRRKGASWETSHHSDKRSGSSGSRPSAQMRTSGSSAVLSGMPMSKGQLTNSASTQSIKPSEALRGASMPRASSTQANGATLPETTSSSGDFPVPELPALVQ